MPEMTPKNPQDAIEATQGKYADAVDKLSPEQKLPMLPKAPDPKAFNVTGGGTPAGQ